MIDAKWAYTWKVDEHGRVVKAKSRLVACGFKQREGVDFSEIFAPTVSSSWVRHLSVIACELDLDLCHFDVDQAFVQSDLGEDDQRFLDSKASTRLLCVFLFLL